MRAFLCLHKFSVLDALHKTPLSPMKLKGLLHLQGVEGFQIIKEAKYISKVKPGKQSSFESVSTESLYDRVIFSTK